MVLPKAPDDILKHLVFSTTQRHSVHCDRGVKKPENIHILDAGIRWFWHFCWLTVAAIIYFFFHLNLWTNEWWCWCTIFVCVGAVCVVSSLCNKYNTLNYFYNKGDIRDVRRCCKTLFYQCFCQLHRIRTCFKHRVAHSASAAGWHLVVRGSHYSREPAVASNSDLL